MLTLKGFSGYQCPWNLSRRAFSSSSPNMLTRRLGNLLYRYEMTKFKATCISICILADADSDHYTHTHADTHTDKLISSLTHSSFCTLFVSDSSIAFSFYLVITFCFLWVELVVVVVVGGGIILAAIRVCVYFSICVAQCSTVSSILNTFIEIFGLLILCCYIHMYTYILYLYICLHMYISIRI